MNKLRHMLAIIPTALGCAHTSVATVAPLHASVTSPVSSPTGAEEHGLPPSETSVTVMHPTIETRPTTPATPPAGEIVRDALVSKVALDHDASMWMPFLIMSRVAAVTGEFPATTAPVFEDDRVLWALLGAPAPSARSGELFNAGCEEITHTVPQSACAVDKVTVGAAERLRIVVGWKNTTPMGSLSADLGTPLRALGRLGTDVCLVSLERTLHTVDVTVRAPDPHALQRVLALFAAAPRMSTVMLVRAEPHDNGTATSLEAVLSWPTDQQIETGTLAHDAWPARCDGHAIIAAPDAAVNTLRAVLPLQGDNARGAVIAAGRREWVLTEGDVIHGNTIVAISERGVSVRSSRPRARDVLLRYTASHVTGTHTEPRGTVIAVPRSIPEPPATP